MKFFIKILVGILLPLTSFAECSKTFSKISPQRRNQVHQEITTDLRDGEIVEAHSARKNGNTHDLWWVTIQNSQTGRTQKAILKPREWGDSDGWARSPMELVAYQLNRKLGMDYVPPTVYRRKLKLNSKLIHETPVIHWVQNAQILYDTPESQWGISKEAMQSDHRILCVLLHNSDGHYKNLLLGEHWVEGISHPTFIDFGASLRPGTSVTMRKYPATGNSEPVSKIRASTLVALEKLQKEDLKEINEFVSEQEIDGILERKEGIVAYFKKLIAENGRNQVVLEN